MYFIINKLRIKEAEIVTDSNEVFKYNEDIYYKPIEGVEASFDKLGCQIQYEQIQL